MPFELFFNTDFLNVATYVLPEGLQAAVVISCFNATLEIRFLFSQRLHDQFLAVFHHTLHNLIRNRFDDRPLLQCLDVLAQQYAMYITASFHQVLEHVKIKELQP